MVECEEEKFGNEHLKKGLDIFEDYCDNVDEGLKTITSQIDQFIRNDGWIMLSADWYLIFWNLPVAKNLRIFSFLADYQEGSLDHLS